MQNRKNCDCSCIIDYQKLISRQKLNWKRFIPQKEIMFKNSKNEVLVVKRIKILLKDEIKCSVANFFSKTISSDWKSCPRSKMTPYLNVCVFRKSKTFLRVDNTDSSASTYAMNFMHGYSIFTLFFSRKWKKVRESMIFFNILCLWKK